MHKHILFFLFLVSCSNILYNHDDTMSMLTTKQLVVKKFGDPTEITKTIDYDEYYYDYPRHPGHPYDYPGRPGMPPPFGRGRTRHRRPRAPPLPLLAPLPPLFAVPFPAAFAVAGSEVHREARHLELDLLEALLLQALHLLQLLFLLLLLHSIRQIQSILVMDFSSLFPKDPEKEPMLCG